LWVGNVRSRRGALEKTSPDSIRFQSKVEPDLGYSLKHAICYNVANYLIPGVYSPQAADKATPAEDRIMVKFFKLGDAVEVIEGVYESGTGTVCGYSEEMVLVRLFINDGVFDSVEISALNLRHIPHKENGLAPISPPAIL
jgi:hypothetical protein